jgi:transposase
VHHRYEWLYVYGFVEPKTGKTLWYLIPKVNHQWLSLVYQSFAKDVGLSAEKVVLLVQDNAGWHRSEKLEVPDGIMLDFLPAYSPELQPAERLWSLVDEPLVNEYFETIEEIEEILITRCQYLETMTNEIKNLTNYHWLTYD